MESYVAGDLSSFDAIYDGTSGRVFAFLLAMTKDRSRAEDLCQTVYLKMHRARASWLRGAPVSPWLMAIARNAFLDDARARGRARVRVTTSGDVPDRAQEGSGRDPAVGLREAIDEAIDALTPRQREAFVLTRKSGLSPREAAQVLGTTETAVKLRVHRAYVALRRALEPFHTEEG